MYSTSFTGSLIGAIQDGVYSGRCIPSGRMQFAQFSRIPELNSVPKHVAYLSINATSWLMYLVRLAKYTLVALRDFRLYEITRKWFADEINFKLNIYISNSVVYYWTKSKLELTENTSLRQKIVSLSVCFETDKKNPLHDFWDQCPLNIMW